jgi:hypothetical protein
MRSDDMSPDYIDRGQKATIWAAAIAPRPPGHDLARTLRRAFDVADGIPDEWDELLARIR